MVNVSSNTPLGGVLEPLMAASYECFDRVVLFGHLMGLTRAGGLHKIYRNALGIKEITPEVLLARTERYRKWVNSFCKESRHPNVVSLSGNAK